MVSKSEAGLAGIIAGQSGIATVGQAGKGLLYRGYSIEDLAAQASFEEVAYLLIYGELPTLSQRDAYLKKLINLRKLPTEMKEILKLTPADAHPMDVLRTACSMLGTLEPEKNFSDQYDIANRLLALFPGILCYWYLYHSKGKEISGESEEETTGGHFLSLLNGRKPGELERDTMNVSLILYAEHEFNASTFTARVTASTLSDFYSAITAAIGSLRGPLHGGANEAAMYLIEQFKSPDEAEKELMRLLANKAKIMGFGHRVYTDSDPRSDIIKKWSYKLAKAKNSLLLYEVSEQIEKVMRREKSLFPNLDFYSASAYHFCDIPTPFFTPIFVMSRITGWAAHVFEQRDDNRLIRPASEYIGPEARVFVPIRDRKLN